MFIAHTSARARARVCIPGILVRKNWILYVCALCVCICLCARYKSNSLSLLCVCVYVCMCVVCVVCVVSRGKPTNIVRLWCNSSR